MATPTYTALATITLSSSASSVTFSSIPSTYRDLILVLTPKTTNDRELGLQFNSDTSAHYSFVQAGGDGSATFSNSSSTRTYARIVQTEAGDQRSGIVQIMDYSATDKHKNVLTRGNADGEVKMVVSRWPSTSAVTTMVVMNNAAESFLVGSTFSLYGIEA